MLLPGLLLAGIGIGLANPTIAHIALGVVAPERSGMASGISNTFRIGGLATGIAALGAVFEQGVQTKLESLLPGSSHALASMVVASGPRAASTQPQTIQAGTVAFVSGMDSLLLVGAVCVAIGALSSFLFVRARDLVHAAAPREQAAHAEAG